MHTVFSLNVLAFPPNWPQINMYHLMGLSVTKVSLYVFKWKHNSYHVQQALRGFGMGLLFSVTDAQFQSQTGMSCSSGPR